MLLIHDSKLRPCFRISDLGAVAEYKKYCCRLDMIADEERREKACDTVSASAVCL